MRIRGYFIGLLVIFVMAALLSSCKAVSEEQPGLTDSFDASGMSENVGTSEADTETVTTSPIKETQTETSASLTEAVSETETAGTETWASETETETEASETETETSRETASQTSETTTASQTEATTAASQTETTALTLQYESPPEATTVSEAKPTAGFGQNSYKTVNFREQKGFWITYLEYGSILKNKSESAFRASIGEYFDNIADLGFNTVYVQVRAFGDAYYDSELFPSGEQYNGTIGSGGSFDALKVMISCAHERGMSIHAWVNPMRLMTSSQMQGISDKYQIKKWYGSDSYNGKYIVKSGDRWYLNPAYDEVTDLIADGISEIVANYNVDGIQIDDYFYPTMESSFDSSAYADSGTALSLSEWRFSNVNKMVKKLYKAAHSANSSISFGISPQGSVENDQKVYADVRTWCSSNGYCDYILPQVYFGFENAALPYENVISQWSGMVSNSNVKLVIGLAAYKVGAVDNYAGAAGKNEWLNNDDIISRQMKLAKELGNYGGVALYRYESVFAPASDVADHVSREVANIKK